MMKRLNGHNADHPAIAASLHEIGTVRQEIGKLDEAENWYKESLGMMQRTQGQLCRSIDGTREFTFRRTQQIEIKIDYCFT